MQSDCKDQRPMVRFVICTFYVSLGRLICCGRGGPYSQNVYPISDPVICCNFSNSQYIYGVRDFVTPQTIFVLFFFAIQCPWQHVTAKNGIPGQTDGIYTLFQTKMATSLPYFRLEMLENNTLWGGTYLYGLYMAPPRAQIVASVGMCCTLQEMASILCK